MKTVVVFIGFFFIFKFFLYVSFLCFTCRHMQEDDLHKSIILSISVCLCHPVLILQVNFNVYMYGIFLPVDIWNQNSAHYQMTC